MSKDLHNQHCAGLAMHVAYRINTSSSSSMESNCWSTLIRDKLNAHGYNATLIPVTAITVLLQSLEATPLTYVDTLPALQEAAARLAKADELAVDLEHHGFRSFQGFTCLMQVSTRNEDLIIDTLALRAHIGPALGPLFADPQVILKHAPLPPPPPGARGRANLWVRLIVRSGWLRALLNFSVPLPAVLVLLLQPDPAERVARAKVVSQLGRAAFVGAISAPILACVQVVGKDIDAVMVLLPISRAILTSFMQKKHADLNQLHIWTSRSGDFL